MVVAPAPKFPAARADRHRGGLPGIAVVRRVAGKRPARANSASRLPPPRPESDPRRLVLPAISPVIGRGLVLRNGRIRYLKRALGSGRLMHRRPRQAWGAKHASGRFSTFRRKTLS